MSLINRRKEFLCFVNDFREGLKQVLICKLVFVLYVSAVCLLMFVSLFFFSFDYLKSALQIG